MTSEVSCSSRPFLFFNFDGILFFLSNSLENGLRKDYQITGIAEQTMLTKKILKYIQPNQKIMFNPIVDINTSCPIITFAIHFRTVFLNFNIFKL